MEEGGVWGPLDPPQNLPQGAGGSPAACAAVPHAHEHRLPLAQSSGLAPMRSRVSDSPLAPLLSATCRLPSLLSPFLCLSCPRDTPMGGPREAQGRSQLGGEVTHQKSTSHALTRLYSHLFSSTNRTVCCGTSPAGLPRPCVAPRSLQWSQGTPRDPLAQVLPTTCPPGAAPKPEPYTRWRVPAILLCEQKARGVALLRATRHL